MAEKFVMKKEFGQNFIQSSEVVDEIVHAINPSEDDFIIEIGPGGGALTQPLSEISGHLSAIEIDPRLVKSLGAQFALKKNVSIISADILQTDLKEILDAGHASDYKKIKIAGNIPYNITSPIITKILESDINFESFTLMIQKEVAERICAQEGTRLRGYMSVMVQYYTEPIYIRTVSKQLFYPIPKVDSAVVHLQFRRHVPVDCDKEKFFKLVKQSFSQKRKTLANNLVGYISPDKKEVNDFLKSLDIDPSRRAETLSLSEFARIVNAL